MRFYLLSVYGGLKRYFNIPLCAVLFAYTAIFSAYVLYSAVYGAQSANIGLCGAPGNTDSMVNFADGISDVINITYYGGIEEMKLDVLKNKIQAGYAFNGSGDEIDIYLTRQSMSVPIINLMLSSVLIQGKSGEYAYSVLREHLDGHEKEYVTDEIQKLSDEYLKKTDLEPIKFEYANKPFFSAVKAENAVYLLIHIFFWSAIFIILSADALFLSGKNYSACFTAMKVNVKIYLLGQVSGAAILTFGFFTFSLLIL